MSQETLNAILIFLGAVVTAVLYVAERQNRRATEAIPPDIMPLFMGLLTLAETLAKATPTLEDDALVARIRAEIGKTAPGV